MARLAACVALLAAGHSLVDEASKQRAYTLAEPYVSLTRDKVLYAYQASGHAFERLTMLRSRADDVKVRLYADAADAKAAAADWLAAAADWLVAVWVLAEQRAALLLSKARSSADELQAAGSVQFEKHFGFLEAAQRHIVVSVMIFVAVFVAVLILQRLLGACWHVCCKKRRRSGKEVSASRCETPAVPGKVHLQVAAPASIPVNNDATAPQSAASKRVSRASTPPPRNSLAEIKANDSGTEENLELLEKLNSMKAEALVNELVGVGSKSAQLIVDARPLGYCKDLFDVLPKHRAAQILKDN